MYHKWNKSQPYMKWRWWSQMVKALLAFYLCEQILYYHDQFLPKTSRSHFHKEHYMHFPHSWKRDFSRINNACKINLLYDVRVFFPGIKVVRGPLEFFAILLNCPPERGTLRSVDSIRGPVWLMSKACIELSSNELHWLSTLNLLKA